MSEEVQAPPARTLWRNRDFNLLLGGQVVSFVGNQVQDIALPLLVLAMTGSATIAGVVVASNTITFLLFGLVAGVLVDRWDRKKAMIWCDTARALLIATVPVAWWLGHLTVAQILIVAVAASGFGTFFQVANTASLPNVVGKEELAPALGQVQAAFNVVRIIGGAIAGALYAVGRVIPFLANALSFAVSVVTLRYIRTDFQEQRRKTGGRITAEIRAGISWLWHQPVVRFLTLINAADSLRYGAGYLIIIVLAQGVHASSAQIGLIFSAAAVGAVVGALLAGRINARWPLGRIAVVMLWVEAAVFPLYAVAPNPLALGVVAAAESVIAPIYNVAITNYRLAITADDMRGRMVSAVQTLTTGSRAIGAILGGALIAAIGAANLAVGCGVWLAMLALATTLNRTVRKARTDQAAAVA